MKPWAGACHLSICTHYLVDRPHRTQSQARPTAYHCCGGRSEEYHHCTTSSSPAADMFNINSPAGFEAYSPNDLRSRYAARH